MYILPVTVMPSNGKRLPMNSPNLPNGDNNWPITSEIERSRDW